LFHQQGPYGERCAVSRTDSFISVGVLKKEASHKMQGKHIVTVHRAPCGWKAYIQWDVAWFPKWVINGTAIITPYDVAY